MSYLTTEQKALLKESNKNIATIENDRASILSIAENATNFSQSQDYEDLENLSSLDFDSIYKVVTTDLGDTLEVQVFPVKNQKTPNVYIFKTKGVAQKALGYGLYKIAESLNDLEGQVLSNIQQMNQ